jgi:hypothetical protein
MKKAFYIYIVYEISNVDVPPKKHSFIDKESSTFGENEDDDENAELISKPTVQRPNDKIKPPSGNCISKNKKEMPSMKVRY